GVRAEALPEIRTSSGQFGVCEGEHLGAELPVAGMAGDQQAALFGQGCVEPGQAKNTYGTGAFLLLNTGRRRPRSTRGLLTTIACGPRGEPVYALEGSVFIAGAAIQWLRDGLKLIDHAAETEHLALDVPDTGGVYFVPAFVGLGAPHWEANARGTIVGLTRGTTRAHLARAALEAMAFSTKDVLDAMTADAACARGRRRAGVVWGAPGLAPPARGAPADEPPHDHRRRRRQHLHLGGSRVGDRRGSPHRQRRRRPAVRRSRWRDGGGRPGGAAGRRADLGPAPGKRSRPGEPAHRRRARHRDGRDAERAARARGRRRDRDRRRLGHPVRDRARPADRDPGGRPARRLHVRGRYSPG